MNRQRLHGTGKGNPEELLAYAAGQCISSGVRELGTKGHGESEEGKAHGFTLEKGLFFLDKAGKTCVFMG